MEAYYNDGRGRYSTGESYDWFYKYEEEDAPQIFTSSDGLWTYGFFIPNEPSDKIELLRYNGNETNINVPTVVDGKTVVSLDSTFDGFYELESVVVPEGVISIIGAFYGCENLKEVILPQGLKCMEYALNFPLMKFVFRQVLKIFQMRLQEQKLQILFFRKAQK